MVRKDRILDMCRSEQGARTLSRALWMGLTGEEAPNEVIEGDTGVGVALVNCPLRYDTERGIAACLIDRYITYMTDKDYISPSGMRRKIETFAERNDLTEEQVHMVVEEVIKGTAPERRSKYLRGIFKE